MESFHHSVKVGGGFLHTSLSTHLRYSGLGFNYKNRTYLQFHFCESGKKNQQLF